MFVKPCSCCMKRPSIDTNCCAICHFLYSPEEQAIYQQMLDEIVQSMPTLLEDKDNLVHWVIRSLPHTLSFRAIHIFDLQRVIGELIDAMIEPHTIEEQ